jgi:hypothetical protein
MHSRVLHRLRVFFHAAAETGAQFIYNHVDDTDDYSQCELRTHYPDQDDGDVKARCVG